MTERDDQQLVDFLYDEMSETDTKAFEQGLAEGSEWAQEVDGLRDTLALMRTLEAEEPPPHLDALVLAHAREVAEEIAESSRTRRAWNAFRQWFWNPTGGLVGLGLTTAVVALVFVPVMSSQEAPQIAFQDQAPTASAPLMVEVEEEAKEASVADRLVATEAAPVPAEAPRVEPSPPPPRPKPAPRRSRARKRRPTTSVQPQSPAGQSLGRIASKSVASPRAEASSSVAEAESSASVAGSAVGYQEGASKDALSLPNFDERPQDRQFVRELIQAAETERARGNEVGARRTLKRGIARLKDAPARGDLMLRLAAWAYQAANYEECEVWATRAARIPGFVRRTEAEALANAARQAAREARKP